MAVVKVFAISHFNVCLMSRKLLLDPLLKKLCGKSTQALYEQAAALEMYLTQPSPIH